MELLKTTKLLHSWRTKQPMSGKLIELENFRTIIQNTLKPQNIKSHQKQMTHLKMNLRLKQRVLKRGGEMAKKCLRNILYSSPLAIRKKAKQTAWRYLSYPKMRMGGGNNHQQLLEWVWGIGNPFSQLGGLQIGPDTWNSRWRILKKLKQNLLYDQIILLFTTPKGLDILLQRYLLSHINCWSSHNS